MTDKTKDNPANGLKVVSTETLQQHVDALNIICNIMMIAIGDKEPETLARILNLIRETIDSTPQLHPELRPLLEVRYLSFVERQTGPLPRQ